MDHADVLHALRETVRVEDAVGDNESDTMERLRDVQVKLGVARYEHYAASQIRMANQMILVL
jgi:beta-lactam-binding protein with PASTA domain